MAKKKRSDFFKLTPQRDLFYKGDRPTQETFRDFADSVTFKEEKEDAATPVSQGLVKLASATNIINQANPSDGFSYTVQPNQLPSVKNGAQTVDDYNQLYNQASAFNVQPSDTTFKRDYEVLFNSDFILWLKSRLFPEGGTPGQVVVKNDSDQKSYNFSWQNLGNSNEFITALLNNSNFLSQLNSKTDPVGTIKMARNITVGPNPNDDFNVEGFGKGRWLGWALCNGAEHNNYVTADLRGKFVVGFDNPLIDPLIQDYKDIGNIGGQKSSQLQAQNLPQHTHSGTTNKDGQHQHGYSRVSGKHGNLNSNNDAFVNEGGDTTYGDATHTHSFTTNGGNGLTSTPFENRPPYYTLAYVEKIS